MDTHDFDAIIRRLADRPTRRTSLSLLGGLLAAPLAARLPVAGKKKKKRSKKACPACRGRKKGKCKKVLADGTPCAGGACQGGTCVPATPADPPACKTGFTRCGDECVNLRSNPEHCGACNMVCGSNECLNGACRCGVNLPCSGTCSCELSVGGLSACTSPNVEPVNCTANAQCPLGSVCHQIVPNKFVCTRTCTP